MEDIIDLEFLIGLDEGQDSDPEALSTRDRDIYRTIGEPGLTGAGLIRKWLDHRRHQFTRDSGQGEALPGRLYTALYRWTARGLTAAGLITGILMAVSFLAYHGRQPVNVTVFIAFFILLQGLLSLTALGVMIRQIVIQRSGPVRGRSPLAQTLISGFFHKRLRVLAERTGDFSGGRYLKTLGEKGEFLKLKGPEYNGIAFWPFFRLSSLFALGFSTGALSGTLFRILVSDLAFGWQSTLLTSGAQIHTLVSWLSLPWSWAMPEALSAPSLSQIEGSRILLKEGIAGLATNHLVSWWPFLCMGILVYGVLTRSVLVLAAARAQKQVLARFNFRQPRYQRLAARMRGPRMDVEIRDTGGTEAGVRPPLPTPVSGTDSPPHKAGATPETPRQKDALTTALVLGAARVYPESAMPQVAGILRDQLGIDTVNAVHVRFDLTDDAPLLKTAAEEKASQGPVIILQEVWQPPIRGLLLYYREVKRQMFPDRPLWIFLTQTPGEEAMGVPGDDVNFQVWKTAVAQLKEPDIIVERWVP